jgi:A/G-specific adenine glycosylase
MARLRAVTTPLPAAKPSLTALAAELTPATRPGDFAQAMMDLGATICTPRRPACGICPWTRPCRARALGIAADLPVKAEKRAKPVRYGVAHLARRADGAWLLERRPENGLLGGTLGWPGSAWTETADPDPAPPVAADWRLLAEEVRHTFTHFHLRLALRLAEVDAEAAPDRGLWIPRHEFRPAALPTVMRKAHALAAAAFPPH